MRPNTIRRKMAKGEKAYGFGITFPSETLIDMAGYVGFDYVHLDAEHGVFDFADIESCCRAL